MTRVKKYRYKHFAIFTLSIIAAFLLLRLESFRHLLTNVGSLGYVGAFFAGALFASTFTVAIGATILLILTETRSPIEIGVMAGFGAMIADLMIFRFVKDDLGKEILLLYKRFDSHQHLTAVLHSRYISWTLPVLGAIIIASPLPDEIGVSLIGISRLKTYQFILISFILNTIGILLLISASPFMQP